MLFERTGLSYIYLNILFKIRIQITYGKFHANKKDKDISLLLFFKTLLYF